MTARNQRSAHEGMRCPQAGESAAAETSEISDSGSNGENARSRFSQLMSDQLTSRGWREVWDAEVREFFFRRGSVRLLALLILS